MTEIIPDSAEEAIETYQSMIVSLSKFLTTNEQLQQDLQQEARIALWRFFPQFDRARGAFPSWARLKVKGAMLTYLRNQSRKNRSAKPTDVATALSKGATTEREFLDLHTLLIEDRPNLIGSAHSKDIRNAIRNLSPRQQEYVYLRFFLDYGQPDLNRYFGYEPGGLWRNQRSGAKVKLRQSLEHLKGE
jgi:RNA polymerase sigma factor (sigma-70 family)